MVNRFQRLWNNLKFLKEILGFRKFLESEQSLSKMMIWQEPYVSLSVFNHGEIYDDFIIRHRDTSQTLPVWQLGLPTDPFWAESSLPFAFPYFLGIKVLYFSFSLLFGQESSLPFAFPYFWGKKSSHTFAFPFPPWKCLWMIQTAKLQQIRTKEKVNIAPSKLIYQDISLRIMNKTNIDNGKADHWSFWIVTHREYVISYTFKNLVWIFFQEGSGGVWRNGLWGGQAVWEGASSGDQWSTQINPEKYNHNWKSATFE